jgi:hypothetical protein
MAEETMKNFQMRTHIGFLRKACGEGAGFKLNSEDYEAFL